MKSLTAPFHQLGKSCNRSIIIILLVLTISGSAKTFTNILADFDLDIGRQSRDLWLWAFALTLLVDWTWWLWRLSDLTFTFTIFFTRHLSIVALGTGTLDASGWWWRCVLFFTFCCRRWSAFDFGFRLLAFAFGWSLGDLVGFGCGLPLGRSSFGGSVGPAELAEVRQAVGDSFGSAIWSTSVSGLRGWMRYDSESYLCPWMLRRHASEPRRA